MVTKVFLPFKSYNPLWDENASSNHVVSWAASEYRYFHLKPRHNLRAWRNGQMIGGDSAASGNPRPLSLCISLSWPWNIQRKYRQQCCDNSGPYADLLKKGAAVIMVVLLSALGAKLISDGVDISGESPNGGFARIASAVVVFAVAIPILLFVVLGWVHP